VGLVGSTYYVNALTTDARKLILANLNFDMLASPNYFRGIYNGVTDPNNPGSGVIQSIFTKFFDTRNITTIPVSFDGRSDYGPFLDYGIAAGGLAAGAEGLKSLSQRALFGGSYGVANDVCYHEFCDTYENCNPDVYLQFVQAAAYTLQSLADQPNLAGYLNGRQAVNLQSTPTTESAAFTSPYAPLHIEKGWVSSSHDKTALGRRPLQKLSINRRTQREELVKTKPQEELTKPKEELMKEKPREFYRTATGKGIHALRWPVA